MPIRYLRDDEDFEGHLFVTLAGCDDEISARNVKFGIQKVLERWYQAGSIAGYRVVMVFEPEGFEDADLDQEMVESVSHGALPVVYCGVTTVVGDPTMADLGPDSELVKTYQLVRVP